MEPQETAGDTFEPVYPMVDGPSVLLGPDWSPDLQAAEWIDNLSDEDLFTGAGVEPYVSTAEAAEYFNRTTQWIYWGLKPDPKTGEVRFVWPDGTPIVPDRVGGQRRFTTPILRAILQSCYRRGNIDAQDLKKIVRRIRYTEVGVEWREREGWHYVDMGKGHHKWVRPGEAKFDSRTRTWRPRRKKRAK